MTQYFWPEQPEERFITQDWEDWEWMYKVCVLFQNKVEFIFLKSHHNFVAILFILPELQNHFFVKLQKDPVVI